jgi:uncharacterized protein YceK
MKKFFRTGLVIYLVLIAVLLTALLLAGCSSVTKTLRSSKTDSIGVITKDTSYFQRDSSGKTFLREVIREYYRDTTHTILEREIIREKGQIVLVNENAGKASSKDTTAKQVEKIADVKETTPGVPIQWINIIIQLIPIALIIYLIRKK